ncbi:transposase [Desulfotruncus alcoholivorax]|uniref:transposase n=1 Tax=Desulfotruncus alcoholivorax TaxID=265477 RepID=UPI00041FCFE5|nr:transposase [Desulfotruncus alcoholivorax]
MQRKRYPKEYKDQLIKEALEIGNAIQVAKRHEINVKTLYRWISESKHKAWQHTKGDAKKTTVYVPSHQEFKQLEKENDKLKQILGEKDLEIAILRDLIKK